MPPLFDAYHTYLEIDDINGSDQFPDDLKVYGESWDDYHCLRRNWESFGVCHCLFWGHKHDLPPEWIMDEIKSILIAVEGRGDFLVQFWKAITTVEGRGTTQGILTGRHQLFGLNSTNTALYAYASMSRFHESDPTREPQHFGLPNRVFRSQQAECTTERRAYPITPRAAAVDCNITASLAFPLFEFAEPCLGVIEIVTNSDRPTNELYEFFRNIVEDHAEGPFYEDCGHLYEHNDKKEKALEEIKKSLEEIRVIHSIPLSRIWIPCRICDALFHIHQEVIESQDSSHLPLLSSGSSIEKGQWAVGKAFLSNKLEFCEVSRSSMEDYPSLGGARRYRVNACFAVPLRRGSRSSSSNEEDDIYVVEFFWPQKYVKSGDRRLSKKKKSGVWRTTAFSLLSTMRQHLKSVSVASGCEIEEDLPIDDRHVENRGETVQLDSPNQEKEKNATTQAGNNNESRTEETNTTIMSSQPKVQHRKAGIPIPLERLQQHFGMKLEDAAESIGVSRSTLKRACREYGILWWQSRKRKNNDNHFIPKKTLQCAAVEKQIGETSEAPISNPSGKQHTETNISTELHEQDISSVTIKAEFGAKEFVRFKLPVTSGMGEFQHQVEKRLHWNDGTHFVWYRDDDNDPILVKIVTSEPLTPSIRVDTPTCIRVVGSFSNSEPPTMLPIFCNEACPSSSGLADKIDGTNAVEVQSVIPQRSVKQVNSALEGNVPSTTSTSEGGATSPVRIIIPDSPPVASVGLTSSIPVFSSSTIVHNKQLGECTSVVPSVAPAVAVDSIGLASASLPTTLPPRTDPVTAPTDLVTHAAAVSLPLHPSTPAPLDLPSKEELFAGVVENFLPVLHDLYTHRGYMFAGIVSQDNFVRGLMLNILGSIMHSLDEKPMDEFSLKEIGHIYQSLNGIRSFNLDIKWLEAGLNQIRHSLHAARWREKLTRIDKDIEKTEKLLQGLRKDRAKMLEHVKALENLGHPHLSFDQTICKNLMR